MIQVSTLAEWEQLKKDSLQKSIVLYIHSLSCPVSAAMLHKMNESNLNDTAYIIPVQTSSEVSKAIEKDLKVAHESPQVVVMKDQKEILNLDHWDIDAGIISKTLSVN
jgi:bacillithiol system protein YtxJ